MTRKVVEEKCKVEVGVQQLKVNGDNNRVFKPRDDYVVVSVGKAVYSNFL